MRRTWTVFLAVAALLAALTVGPVFAQVYNLGVGVFIGSSGPLGTAALSVTPSAVGNVGAIIQALASQTGDLLDARNSAGSVLAGFNSAAALFVGASGTPIVGHFSGTATLTPGSVAAASKVATTMTVTGAVTTNTGTVYCSGAASPGVIAINAFVSAANTVTVEFVNASAAAITPTSQTYRCDVFQH